MCSALITHLTERSLTEIEFMSNLNSFQDLFWLSNRNTGHHEITGKHQNINLVKCESWVLAPELSWNRKPTSSRLIQTGQYYNMVMHRKVVLQKVKNILSLSLMQCHGFLLFAWIKVWRFSLADTHILVSHRKPTKGVEAKLRLQQQQGRTPSKGSRAHQR